MLAASRQAVRWPNGYELAARSSTTGAPSALLRTTAQEIVCTLMEQYERGWDGGAESRSAVDFSVTQVADGNWGVRKKDIPVSGPLAAHSSFLGSFDIRSSRSCMSFI
jgi:hypothetical protein